MQMVGRGLRGLEAKGTENAYIVSFHDKWEKIKFWMKPEFVTSSIIETPPASSPKDNDNEPKPIVDINTQELLEKLYDAMKVNILSKENADIIPDGWYAVFDEENEMDYNITVYDDQILGYQLLEDSIEMIIDGSLEIHEIINNIFKDSNVKPDIKEMKMIVEHIKDEKKMPVYYTFEQRKNFDPKIIAKQMLKAVADDKAYEYWLKDYYDKYSILENLYRTFYAFKKTVLDSLKEYKEAEIIFINDKDDYKVIE